MLAVTLTLPSTQPGDTPPAAPVVKQTARHLSLAVICAFLVMLVFLEIAHHILRDPTFGMDNSIVQYFQRHQSPPLHAGMQAVSVIAGPFCEAAIGILAVILFARVRLFWPDGFSLLVAMAGGLVLLVGLKYAFHRPRPTDLFVEHMKHPGYSFPSGHSFFALVVYGILAYWLTRQYPGRWWIWPLSILFILLVGFSRVFLGAHYPSDVIGGFCVAFPWTWACLALSNRLKKENPQSHPNEIQDA